MASFFIPLDDESSNGGSNVDSNEGNWVNESQLEEGELIVEELSEAFDSNESQDGSNPSSTFRVHIADLYDWKAFPDFDDCCKFDHEDQDEEQPYITHHAMNQVTCNYHWCLLAQVVNYERGDDHFIARDRKGDLFVVEIRITKEDPHAILGRLYFGCTVALMYAMTQTKYETVGYVTVESPDEIKVGAARQSISKLRS